MSRLVRVIRWLKVAVPAYGWRGVMTRKVTVDILTNRELVCTCCGRTNRDDYTTGRYWPDVIQCGECEFGVCDHA